MKKKSQPRIKRREFGIKYKTEEINYLVKGSSKRSGDKPITSALRKGGWARERTTMSKVKKSASERKS